MSTPAFSLQADHPSRVTERRLALLALTVTAFLLTAAPRAGVKLGPIPLYLIDACALACLYFAYRAAPVSRTPFGGHFKLIALFAVLGELGAYVYSGDLLRPIYATGRTLLALSMFYCVSRLVQTEQDLKQVIVALALGIGLTSILMVFSSLPATKYLVYQWIFANPYLDPAAGEYNAELILRSRAERGRSLVGVSILSAAFINSFWPLIALLYRLPGTGFVLRQFALACTLLAPFAIVMSYSRGAMLGALLVMLGVSFFGSKRVRQGVTAAVALLAVVIIYVGYDSDSFLFERLENRTRIMLENPTAEAQETERLFSYTEPFEHVVENPVFLLVGEGTSISKTQTRPQRADKATHSAFAMAYYCYGMLAAFVYLLLLLSLLRYLFYQTRIPRGPHSLITLYYQALFAGALGMSSWFLLGHAVVSEPRGAMMLAFFTGLVCAVRNVEAQPAVRLVNDSR